MFWLIKYQGNIHCGFSLWVDEGCLMKIFNYYSAEDVCLKWNWAEYEKNFGMATETTSDQEQIPS